MSDQPPPYLPHPGEEWKRVCVWVSVIQPPPDLPQPGEELVWVQESEINLKPLSVAVLKGAEDFPFYFGAKPETMRLAAELRRSMTEAEKILWKRLRNHQLAGYRFRRQHPVNEFIIDFFCYEAMLAVEIDGDVHNDLTQTERDIERTRILNELGIAVIRFSNDDVENCTTEVIYKLIETLRNRNV